MRRSLIRRGFTLVELMIAIAVVGVISVVIYQLFDVTSQNFREVNQLASMNDRMRFANEQLRVYLQQAGAQATPDSASDPDVRPPLTGNGRVVGILPYNGWQNNQPAAMAAANPNASYDGFIVLGAYDFATSFEMAGMVPSGGNREAWLPNTGRAVHKLFGQDPFADGILNFGYSDLNRVSQQLSKTNMNTRLIRLMDRQGYKQFLAPNTIAFIGDQYVTIGLDPDGSQFGPKFKQAGELYGIDDLPEGDTGYDAAFLDAYWIHVEPSPADPNMMQLVRERLCADIVVSTGATAAFTPDDALPTECGGIEEKVVLASYVADFQVWFDCASATSPSGGAADGSIHSLTWDPGWDRDDHTTTDADCMSLATLEPGRARAAHVRLALHTRQERPDQRHVQFEDLNGPICPPTGGGDSDVPGACDAARRQFATLRTFDYMPNTKGTARVVVMQSDFELVNFVNRNQL